MTAEEIRGIDPDAWLTPHSNRCVAFVLVELTAQLADLNSTLKIIGKEYMERAGREWPIVPPQS